MIADRSSCGSRTLVPVLLVVLAVTGCQKTERTLELHDLFSLQPTTRKADVTAVGADPRSPSRPLTFEERVSGRSSASKDLRRGYPSETASAELEAHQRIRLGSGLVAELPTEGWRWARDDRLVLAVARRGESPPHALILSQAFPRTANVRPADAMNRFLLTVKPDLASGWGHLQNRLELWTASASLDSTPAATRPDPQVARTVGRVLNPTLGRGLGFHAPRDHFGGWKWLGPNPQGLYLRLARSQGEWGRQPEIPDAFLAVLEILAEENPDLADLLWTEPPRISPNATPAFLVVGSGELPEQRTGVHLAMLCRLNPGCSAQGELRAFLDSLGPEDPRRAPRPPVGENLQDLALNSGLALVPDARRRYLEAVEASLQAVAGDAPSAPQDETSKPDPPAVTQGVEQGEETP